MMGAPSAATLALCSCLTLPANALAAGNDAKGTLAYKTRTATPKYAYLVKAPTP